MRDLGQIVESNFCEYFGCLFLGRGKMSLPDQEAFSVLMCRADTFFMTLLPGYDMMGGIACGKKATIAYKVTKLITNEQF